MLPRSPGWNLLLLLALSLPAAPAAERCTLRTYTLPVTMEGTKALVSARINGAEARFIVDTGAFFQMMSLAVAAQYKLDLEPAPFGFTIGGIGGSVHPQIATVKDFTLGNVPFHDVQFLVGGNDRLPGVAGFMGENLFSTADLELDLANGVLRLVKPEHCGGQELAYWAKDEAVAVVDLRWRTERQSKLIGEARLNGHTIRVLFDTGASRSVLSWRAARRAGISPGSPGVVRLGMISGIGPEPVALWTVPVGVFEIGGEKIEHTRMAVADIDLPPPLDADMLLGADFFLAHHIYVSNSQDKLYFTYNGGPVFNLSVPKTAQSAPGSLDAAGLLRRGMGYASRQEFALALADLTRACDLAPKDEQCRYQRGLAYWRSGQLAPALADLDTAITLDPDDFQAHLARAQLEVRQRPSAVEDDLYAVDHLAPPQASLRLAVGQLYDRIGEYAGAVHQYDLWIDYHADDVSLPFALAGRCGSEAMANVDVERGLDDCNRALRMMPKAAPIRTSAITMSDRGLIYLRLGKSDDALADFAAALKRQPRLPVALYGRGLAEEKKGLKAQGQADLAAAASLRPGLPKRLASFGLAR